MICFISPFFSTKIRNQKYGNRDGIFRLFSVEEMNEVEVAWDASHHFC